MDRPRLFLQLTAKGLTAYWAHKHWHQTMDGGFSEYISKLQGSELEIIVDFLERVEAFLEKRIQSTE